MAVSEKAKQILNRPDLIARQNLWFERMQGVFDGGNGEWNRTYVYGVNGICAAGQHDPYTEPELWVEDCLEDLARRYAVMENEIYFRPLCVEWTIYGVHFVDKILGANVRFYEGQWYTEYLNTPIGQLKKPDLEACEAWQLTKRAVKAFLDADVKLPLFSMPVIASSLNIAVNLYGAEVLVELIDDPEKTMADFRVINELLCQIHSWFRENIPQDQLQPVVAWNRTQPPGYGQICGCSTHLLSGELYKTYLAALDDELLAVHPHGGMIHLCGKHTQHLEAFREMKHLKALQLNDRAAQDFPRYYENLREDQILYFNPCEAYGIEQAMELSGGHRLVIPEQLEAPVLRRQK